MHDNCEPEEDANGNVRESPDSVIEIEGNVREYVEPRTEVNGNIKTLTSVQEAEIDGNVKYSAPLQVEIDGNSVDYVSPHKQEEIGLSILVDDSQVSLMGMDELEETILNLLERGAIKDDIDNRVELDFKGKNEFSKSLYALSVRDRLRAALCFIEFGELIEAAFAYDRAYRAATLLGFHKVALETSKRAMELYEAMGSTTDYEFAEAKYKKAKMALKAKRQH